VRVGAQAGGVILRGQPRACLAGGAVRIVVMLFALTIIHLLVIAGIVRVVRHNARLGAGLLKRYNALVLPTAGRRFSPYAVLRHTGRRSGRTYRTPLVAYQFGDGFVMGLTYGPTVDWCRNVVASGHAVLRWRGQSYPLERPEIIPIDPHVLRAFPLPFRSVLARELSQCLWLHHANHRLL
jgi:deazaflavin-dependent oxidoreductase (nitroreductase family)